MKPRHRPPPDTSQERSVQPFPGWFSRWRSRLAVFRLRDYWWQLLDFLEASRAARVALYLGGIILVLGGAAWFWAYPRWVERNAIRIAEQWLAAGQLKYAAEAAQRAAEVAPGRPEPWQIAAELARRGGQREEAVRYARRAAELAPTDSGIVIAWAADALRADLPAEAHQALGTLPIEVLAASPHAQRIQGEIARRELRLTSARRHFEAAARLEGPLAINEVPLGLILLQANEVAVRQHGRDLLVKWTADRDWGATALRTLLADALLGDDLPLMRQWAEALRTHPGCTVGDMPNCLLALAKADPSRFAEVLAQLERDHAVRPQAALQLLSWLNQIGQGAEAVRWMNTLPAQAMRRPPLVVAGAEALRLTADWPALQAWTREGDWGPEVEFLRWTYGLQAARMLGEETPAEELYSTLLSHAQLNSAHALFAGSTLYGWGRVMEAEGLWWRVAEQEGRTAIDALGSLARHYQVQREAEGLYKVFRKLHSLQPQDAAVSNNFAFYAVLTSHEQRVAEILARSNHEADPDNLAYLATYAFTLSQQGRAAEAMALLKPRAADAEKSPPLAFAYGLALAGSGHQQEARSLLEGLPPTTLTRREVDLIQTALGN